MDEHRIGLKPLRRRCWAGPGRRPLIPVEHRYAWLYVYGFVHPASGRTFWLLMPTVSIPAFSAALHTFATFAQADSAAEIRLLVDRAGWHTSPKVDLPQGLRLWFLPPYSPELQPAEHLWSLTDQPLANRHFDSLDQLEAVQGERCNWLQDHPELVRSTTCFHWWPSYA
ncbi:MAG: IS630 family transposase [Anaerolineae bacterium]|nr:MAG: IS630 family transposase [Anaerolineae bacterium]